MRAGQTCFLCILHVKNVRRNIIGLLSKKKQYITPLPRSLQWVAALSNMTTGSNVELLKLYTQAITFFIFCPICLKFSHNILHTYSFILGIIKHNWKIRRFWVADSLKKLVNTVKKKKNFDMPYYMLSIFSPFSVSFCIIEIREIYSVNSELCPTYVYENLYVPLVVFL